MVIMSLKYTPIPRSILLLSKTTNDPTARETVCFLLPLFFRTVFLLQAGNWLKV